MRILGLSVAVLIRRPARSRDARPGRLPLIVMLLMAALGGCIPRSSQPSPTAVGPTEADVSHVEPRSVDAWNTACRRAGLGGDGLAIAGGPDGNNAFLFTGSVCPFGLSRVPEASRVSAASVGGGRVVLTHGANGYDQLAEVRGGQLRLVEGVPRDRRIFTPLVGSSGDLVYVDGDDPGGEALRLLPPGAESEVLFQSATGTLGWPAWGPEGALVVAEGRDTTEGSEASLVVIEDDGRTRNLSTPFSEVVGLAWSPEGPIAASPPPGEGQPPAIVVDSDTGATISTLPEGWIVHDFTPNGASLMVGRGEEMAYLSAPDFDRLHPLPPSPLGPTWGLAYEE